MVGRLLRRTIRPDDESIESRRGKLIEQLRRQGIADERVLSAISTIPRHVFIPSEHVSEAWENVALPIENNQTISQPVVVAIMSEALELRGSERVLEIGTGSGYQAALLSMLAREVITIERLVSLSTSARDRLDGLGIENVTTIVGDGAAGWDPGAPYDAIMVTAGARAIPSSLLEQLSEEDGRMVIPLGPAEHEHLRLFRKQGDELTSTDLGAVRFVPLIVDEGESTQE